MWSIGITAIEMAESQPRKISFIHSHLQLPYLPPYWIWVYPLLVIHRKTLERPPPQGWFHEGSSRCRPEYYCYYIIYYILLILLLLKCC